MSQTFPLSHLKLAISLHLVRRVLRSDGEVTPVERAFLAKQFPSKILHKVGFLGDNGRLTSKFLQTLGEALIILPDELSADERLALFDRCVSAAMADDMFQAEESDIVHQIARCLALGEKQISEALSRAEASQVIRELPHYDSLAHPTDEV